MIIGIGTDIVEVARIAQSIRKLGNRFIEKNFSEAEITASKKWQEPAAYFAKRFAAKEALAKAFGTGIGGAAAFKDISTLNHINGAPYMQLTGNAAKTIDKLTDGHDDKSMKIHVTLSDEKLYAQAFVILELI